LSSKSSIAPRELIVAFVAASTLAFTSWALAGYPNRCLHLLFVGSILTFLFSICPLPAWFNGNDGSHGNWKNLSRLLRFPVFWLCFLFLAYVLIQALNPAVIKVNLSGQWWVEAVHPPLGLKFPTGVRSDFTPMNAFRVLEIFGASFSLLLGLWVGLRRRATAISIIWVFSFSGAAMAIVAMIQSFTGADKVLWSIASQNQHFWGTFFYRNQGAAFLTLVLVATGFLFFYHAKNASESGNVGGPHLLLFVFFILIASSIGLSLSRGGILVASLVCVVFLLLLFCHILSSSSSIRIFPLVGLFGFFLCGGVYFGSQLVDLKSIQDRFEEFKEAPEKTRILAAKATWEMAEARLTYGWGAGSFRYIFPLYQQKYPELYYGYKHRRLGWQSRKIFHYAHTDLLQFVAEYGIVGTCFLLGILGSWIVSVLRYGRINVLAALIILAGVLGALGHAAVDFIFSSPAYWIGFIGFLAVALKLLSLECHRTKVAA